jgi:hypothetical protein
VGEGGGVVIKPYLKKRGDNWRDDIKMNEWRNLEIERTNWV